MLETAKKKGYRFETVQMPVNVLDSHFRSFSNLVTPVAQQMDVAVLGMKSIGGGVILESGAVTAEECLRFALSQPVAVVITGIDSEEILDQALKVGADPRPFTQSEIADLRDRTSSVASQGEYELFKTSNKFDATAKNLEWLGEEFAAKS